MNEVWKGRDPRPNPRGAATRAPAAPSCDVVCCGTGETALLHIVGSMEAAPSSNVG